MRRVALLLPAVALVVAACGSSSPATSPTTQPAVAESSTGGSPDVPAAGSVDPAQAGSCGVLTQEQMASIFGSATGAAPVFDPSDTGVDCQWSSDDGRQIGYKITFFNPPDTWLLRAGTAVPVGDEAYVSGEGVTLALEADLKGWLVDIWTPANESGAVTADDLVALAALLDSVLIPNPNDISPGGPGGGSVDPGSGGGVAIPGALVAMDVTVDAPSYLAGSASVGEAEIAADFSYRCVLSGFLEVSFQPAAALPGLAAEVLSIRGDVGDATTGTHPVEFDFLARVQPPTSSFPFVEFFSQPGEVTLAGDGSLTFTISDDGFGNSVTGSVRCSFAG